MSLLLSILPLFFRLFWPLLRDVLIVVVHQPFLLLFWFPRVWLRLPLPFCSVSLPPPCFGVSLDCVSPNEPQFEALRRRQLFVRFPLALFPRDLVRNNVPVFSRDFTPTIPSCLLLLPLSICGIIMTSALFMTSVRELFVFPLAPLTKNKLRLSCSCFLFPWHRVIHVRTHCVLCWSQCPFNA